MTTPEQTDRAAAADDAAAGAMSGATADALSGALIGATSLTMGVLTSIGTVVDQSLTGLRLLLVLHETDLRMSELAGFLGLDKSSVTGLVARSERRGLVSKRRDSADARVTVVSATPAGRELADAVRAQLAAALGSAAFGLSESDQRTLIRLLTKLLS
jgi:DNA-binding MarR family transcriptional regulator